MSWNTIPAELTITEGTLATCPGGSAASAEDQDNREAGTDSQTLSSAAVQANY